MYRARREARGSEPVARPRRWRRRLIVTGAVVLTAAIIGISAYAWWVHTHVRAVRAAVSAAMVSLSPPADVRVQTLHAQPGSEVTEGQPLIRFDDSEARASLEAAEAERTIAASKHAQAEATDGRTEIRVEAEIEAARAAVAIAAARAAGAQASLGHRKARLPEEIRRAKAECDATRARLDRLTRGSLPQDIETAKVKLATAKALENLATLELRQAEDLVAQGLEPANSVQIQKAKLIACQGTVREAELALARLEAGPTAEEIEAARQALTSREATLSLATTGSREVEVLVKDVLMRKAEHRQAEAELKGVEATRLEITLAKERVKAAAAELKRAEAEVARRRAVLQAMTIVSPVAGTVYRTYHRPGEVCKKGEVTILVVDDSAGRWVEAYVREEDAQYIKVGQSADVLLADGTSAGATVDAVALSTSSLVRPQAAFAGSAPPGNPSEMVRVRLTLTDQEAKPLPGMTARAVIRVR